MLRKDRSISRLSFEIAFPAQRLKRPALPPLNRPLKLGFKQFSFHHMRFTLTAGLDSTFSSSFRLFPGCFVHVPLSRFQPFPAPLTWGHTQSPALWALSHSFLARTRRTQSSVSDAKRRGIIPVTWLDTLRRLKSVNPDWILYGVGSKYLTPADVAQSLPHVVKVTEIRPPEECPSFDLFRELVRRALKEDELEAIQRAARASWLPVRKDDGES